MTNKVTIKDNLIAVRAFLADNGADSALIEFIDGRIENVEKKNAKRSEKPTKKQVENAGLIDEIYACMESGVSYRVKDIKALVPALAGDEISINKVSALVRKMRENVMVSREMVKGTAYFTKI